MTALTASGQEHVLITADHGDLAAPAIYMYAGEVAA